MPLARVTVDLNILTAQAVGDGLGTDALAGIENLIGSGLVDVLTGDANANRLTGGGGADTLSGGTGVDTLNGDGGDDTFRYDATADIVAGEVVDGGGGTTNTILINATGTFDFTGASVSNIQRLQFAASLASSTTTTFLASQLPANLAIVGPTLTTANVRFNAGATTLLDVTAMTVTSGNVSLELIGDGDAETFLTWGGNEVVVAGGGNDTVRGSLGIDNYQGDGGSDTLDYSTTTSGISMYLDGISSAIGAEISVDTYEAFENVIGGSGGDFLYGDLLDGGLDNSLVGNGGADILDGGSGDDTLRGGAGNDSLDGGGNGAGGDTADYSDATGTGVTVNLAIGGGAGRRRRARHRYADRHREHDRLGTRRRFSPATATSTR